ncbi:MAG: rane protein of unknown function [Candidatus Taylorbacteria bacterium]|nr:rane protein of unknown function [Candidatus Taylorbacteria bacterium]
MIRHLIVTVIAILIGAFLLTGVKVTIVGAIIFAVVLGLINIFIRPIIFILTLPVNILTLGLFSLVINAALILLAAHFVPGVVITGFWPALWFSIIIAVFNVIFGRGHKAE